MTYLAVPIGPRNVEIGLTQIAEAMRLGAEIVEIRADYLDEPGASAAVAMVEAARRAGLKIIVTARDVRQGGFKEIDEAARLEILAGAVGAGADYVDCEFINYTHAHVRERINNAIGQSQCRLIISHHDFTKPFVDLEVLYAEVIAMNGNAIPKLIYTARHVNDCFAAFDLLHEKEGELICFAMGAAGMISRIIARKLGAFLTFATIDLESATAPGQLTIEQLKNIYRWDAIGNHTSLYGVIGSPVAQSKGPLIHNACFAHTGLDSLYLPILLEGDWVEFKTFMDGCLEREWLGVKGFSVTIPHKENAMEYVHQTGGFVDSRAIEIGAANTLTVALGRASAFNTDYDGALDAIVSGLEDKNKLNQMPAAVVGAGGVARAVIAALTHAGAKVTIFNRTIEKSRHLARTFNCHYEPIENLAAISDAKLLVNCTSLGMYPEIENTPVPAELLRAGMLVFDTVYNPRQTRLLKDARTAGARTVDGLEMFVAQARRQFEHFTGREADINIIKQILENAI
ncbi:MAG: shikimate dehydrogenase [Planctomycetes bacterium GWF2_50_10]|nr:MAG: shikimate dehydrogenase [Planctomycetes bacterium GWF2_50_10]